MKKLTLALLSAIFCMSIPLCAFAANEAQSSGAANKIIMQIGKATMTVDGENRSVDSGSAETVPVVVSDRTLLPVRAVVEVWEAACHGTMRSKQLFSNAVIKRLALR
jgi:hypothetical protein